MLLEVVKSNRKNKRFMAVFSNGSKVHVGLDGGSTYIDHHNILKRFIISYILKIKFKNILTFLILNIIY